MIHLILMLAVITPPGQAEAMDAFAEGEFYLVTFGKMTGGEHRDESTGILLNSLGCVIGEGDTEYREDWNGYILHTWDYLGSDSTFFMVRTEEESLEYSRNQLIYRDQWGSVPVEIFPEDLAELTALLRSSAVEDADHGAVLVMYSPLWEDTVVTGITGDGIAGELMDRGRRAIRINQLQ